MANSNNSTRILRFPQRMELAMFMFGKPALAIAIAMAIVIPAGVASAQSPHYIFLGAPALGGDDNLNYTLKFKEAGLGNIGDTAQYTLNISSMTVTYQCFNKGGHTPQGVPFNVGPVPATDQQVFTVSKNGSVSGTMDVEEPELPGDAKCTGQGYFCATAFSYTGATLTDPFGNTTTLDDLNGSNVLICKVD